jgi:hypothetical protein
MADNPTKLFSIDVMVTLPDNKREINFSLVKNRNEDNSERWFIEFSLKEHLKIDGTEKTITRVDVKVEILDQKKIKAAATLAEKGQLSQEKTKYLLGKVQATAAAMPEGTVNAKPAFKEMLTKVI